MMDNREILMAMRSIVGQIAQEAAAAPEDNEGWLLWANELVEQPPNQMRRCVRDVCVLGPTMAFLRSVHPDIVNDPSWQAMVECSQIASKLCGFYAEDGSSLTFEGWVDRLASYDAPIIMSDVQNREGHHQIHTEYLGCDVRLPDQVLEDEPITIFSITYTDGEGEPPLHIPTRYAQTLDEARHVHESWVKELEGV